MYNYLHWYNNYERERDGKGERKRIGRVKEGRKKKHTEKRKTYFLKKQTNNPPHPKKRLPIKS